MQKSIGIKQKSKAPDGLDSNKPELSGTFIKVSEATIAFHYEKNGTVREFLAIPSGWLEVPPGELINGYLAHKESPKLAMDILEGGVDSQKDETLIAKSTSGEFPLFTAPARVPLRIGIPRGRKSFKRWMTRNRCTWAVDRGTGQARLVTFRGRSVDVPDRWRSAFEELATEVHTEWGPAVAYISLLVNQLCWAEATVLRERGALLRDCRAGHRFVWIGRTTKQWCSWHERERDALETRYTRASRAEKKTLVADLKRLGLRRRGQGIRAIRARRGASTAGGAAQGTERRRGTARDLVMPKPEEVEHLSGNVWP